MVMQMVREGRDKGDSISEIIKISRLLSSDTYLDNEKLVVPVFQRPYRWTQKNVTDLLTDLYYQCKRIGHTVSSRYDADNAYRLGTVVLHESKAANDDKATIEYELVDGQQRTLTLLLLIQAINESGKFREQLRNFKPVEIQLPACTETQRNLLANFEILLYHVNSPEFTAEVLDFLLNQCEIVKVKLDKLSEAFQFFDSQNARGLDLSPHDLLKAYHLREFAEGEDSLKRQVVEYWESQQTKILKYLFANYLYPIRRWSIGRQALDFSKSNVATFKGINLDENSYPFHHGLNIIHRTIENYNLHPHRLIDNQTMSYPYQLTQIIINGSRFFEWFTHYQRLITPLEDEAVDEKDSWLYTVLLKHEMLQRSPNNNECRPTALVIMQVLNNQIKNDDYKYSHWWRKGDTYVRRMFNALVLCYYDRFGEQDLPRAIEYIFIWTYSLRLTKSSVYLEGIEKHIRKNNLFIRLQQSLSPVDFLNKPLKRLVDTDLQIKNRGTVAGVITVFKELGYFISENSDGE